MVYLISSALGTDTGGSVRLPAAYTGTVGFKPSYGLLSRWGVVAYANSLDTVGILGRTTSSVRDVFSMFSCPSTVLDTRTSLTVTCTAILNKHDPRDPTSITSPSRSRIHTHLQSTALAPRLTQNPLRIGVPLDYNISELTPSIRQAWHLSLAHLQSQGHTIHQISLPATKHALSAYYVLAPAEASSNLAKYDGVRYGTRAEGPDSDGQPESYLYANTRGQGFGAEVQRRILLGTFSLSADAMDNYFIQAQRVRRLVQQDFDAVFAAAHPFATTECHETKSPNSTNIDVIVCPTAPSPPPRLGEITTGSSPLDAYVNDVFTVPASLAGLPAISVPVTVSALGRSSEREEVAGIQIIGQYGDDELVMNVGELLENQKMVGQE